MNMFHFSHNRCLRWIFRFRKRCGYGIHSPFAFNLVTGVIYEKGEYYAYHDLLLLGGKLSCSLRLKDNRFLFRLVNHHQPKNALVIGDHLDLTYEYLKKGRNDCEWLFLKEVTPRHLQEICKNMKSVDFLFLDYCPSSEKLLSELMPYTDDRTLVVVHGIHKTVYSYEVWRKFIADSRVRVSFDLYDFGLAYFEERLNKENYIINYF